MNRKARPAFIIIVAVIVVCGHFAAEGCYQPEAGRKLPNIPTQRALLQYRNGIETLILDSSPDGEKNNMGWIIPLPHQPLQFDTMSAGLLKTLSLQIQPKIHNEKRFENVTDIYGDTLVSVLILVLCFIFMRWGVKGGIWPTLLFVLFIILYPRFMVDRPADYRAEPEASISVNPIAEIKDSAVVGNYDLFVLKVRDSSELNSWLGDNGLIKFQPEAAGLIDNYIARHWYFAVAKPNMNSGGRAPSQAVFLKFETDRPVYPMQRMALAGSSVYLELFVVGENEAVPVNHDIKSEYCNFFDFKNLAPSGFFSESFDRNGFRPRKDFEPDREIAHSDASKVMWDGCVVTKLTDIVTAGEMKEDMIFEFKKAIPYQKQLYSSKAKFDKAYSDTLSVAAIGAILLTIFYRIARKRWHKLGIAWNWLLLFISCATVFVYTYISLGETTEIYTVERSWRSDSEVPPWFYFNFPGNPVSSGEELIELLNQMGFHNPITNEPIILEDSPGNITWEGSGDDIKIKFCLRDGSLYTLPHDLPILTRYGTTPNVLGKQLNFLPSQ